MLGRPGELHLVHGMFVAEKPSTFSTVNLSIRLDESLPTRWLRAAIVRSRFLPVFPSNNFIWIRLRWFWNRCSCRSSRRARGLVRLENIQPLELLIEHSQWLKSFSLDHLSFEPVFNFILFDHFQIFVNIVKVSKSVCKWILQCFFGDIHLLSCSNVTYHKSALIPSSSGQI